MAISYSAAIAIIITGAAATVVVGYALWRLYFFQPHDDPHQMSDDQKHYLRGIREKYREGLMFQARSRI